MASTPKDPAKSAPVESIYSASELIDNAKMFGTNRDIVAVALRKAGVSCATVKEAQNIINEFKNKEVK